MYNVAFVPKHALTFETIMPCLNQFMRCLHATQAAELVVDLSHITLCDSAGLALLIEAKRMCRQQNKVLVIQGVPSAIKALAKFCGVDTLLTEP